MHITPPFGRVEIEGTSMIPTFQSGDRVIIWRWGTIREGDTVVFCKNGLKMVKRAVSKINERWMVRGDNTTASSDSSDFGEVEDTSIMGKVVAKY